MCEIKKTSETIDGTEIEVFQRETWSACGMEFSAGTNGYRGGDAGHGSVTLARIRNLAGTSIEVKTKDGTGVDIILRGDCELYDFCKGLRFILDVLSDGRRGMNE